MPFAQTLRAFAVGRSVHEPMPTLSWGQDNVGAFGSSKSRIIIRHFTSTAQFRFQPPAPERR